jgi:hypothetical protein
MMGGGGSNAFQGDMSKDIIIGNYVTLLLDTNGTLLKMNRLGLPGGPTDLITSVMGDIYMPQGAVGVELGPQVGNALESLSRELASLVPISFVATTPDIVLGVGGSATQGPSISMGDQTGGTAMPGGVSSSGSSTHGSSAAPAGQGGAAHHGHGAQPQGKPHQGPAKPPAKHTPKPDGNGPHHGPHTDAGTPPQGASGTGQGAPGTQEAPGPEGAASGGSAPGAGGKVSMAAGVSILGLSGVLGSVGNSSLSVVFDAESGSWKPRAAKRRGPSVLDVDPADAGTAEAVEEALESLDG